MAKSEIALQREQPPMPLRQRRRRGAKVEGRTPKARPDRRARGGACEEERKDGGATGGKWIQGAIKHPGALHKALHVPEGQKIPEAKLEKAEHSSNPTMRKRANLAKTLKGMK